MIPLSVIKDDNEHTMHYSQSLPYAHLLDNEAELWLSEICNSLFLSIKAKDFSRGAVISVRRLASYLDMKHAIPRETRATLAKLLYDLVIMPGMDPALVELWSVNCIRLIRNKKRLGSEDIELEWRPLYYMIERILFPKSRQRSLMSESKLMGAVLRLVGYAQRFFPPHATKEILTEFLPKFTTHSVSDAIRAQGYLVLFLPIEYQPQHTMHAQDYLSTIYSLWSIFSSSPSYDAQFTYLVSRIAESNLDQGQNIGLFTKQQIASVFTTGLRMMNLPVGSRSDGSNAGAGAAAGTTTGYGSQGLRVDAKAGSSLFLRKKPEKFKSLARFIVYTIMPDPENENSSYSLSLLSDMIQATELYFHPSNHGAWSYLLTGFARHLASEFLKRWREEEEEDCTTPKHRRLTVELRKEFVLILRPVTYLSMFGKDQYTVGASQSTLKYLSWLEPGLIFPGLLERIYPSLETLTETHRTSSALSILADIALPLFSRDHYPAGGKHLLPLLQLAIPGIDMNDPIKTIASLMFISTALMSIPIFDLTETQPDYFPIEDLESPELSRETEDYLVRSTTGEFGGWLGKFLRRVFTIFENLPQENRKKGGSGATMETGLTQMVLHTCDIIFGQLSEPLYDLALRLIIEFVTDRVLPNAVRAVGLLCDAITSANPRKAAKTFIPLCIVHLRLELDHGAASTMAHAASSTVIQSDSTFHWYQNILFSVVSNLGPELLPYRSELRSIVVDMVQKCKSRRGMMWSGKLIRSILNTTFDTYPQEFKSLTPSQWKEMAQSADQVWGQPGDPTRLEIQWHTPSEPEKDFALEFLLETITPSIDRLNEMMKDPAVAQGSHAVSNEFCRHLAVVRNCLMGSAMMVGEDGLTYENKEEGEEEVVTYPRLVVGYAFSDPTDPRTQQAQALRRTLGDLIHRLSIFFMTEKEDDVESVKILIKIARHYLSERGVEKAQLDRCKSGYSYAKNIGKTPLCKKRYPRNLLIRRAYNHHLLRLRQNVQGLRRHPLYDAILMDLLEMSLGPYAEIRKVSQNALSATARCFIGSKALILPTLLTALEPTTTPDRMKGSLYLFTHKSILMPCLRDWRFIPDFVMALCRAQHQDKPSIQELVRKVFMDYISHINTFSFRVIVPDRIQTDPTLPIAIKVQQRSDEMVTAYQGLMEQLLDFMQDSRVHWRFATMAANLIEVLLRSDMKPTERLAEFANQATLSELPTMRRIGVSASTQLLLYIKQRTFAAGDPDRLITRDLPNPLKVQQEPGMLIDHPTGWYVWPETYSGYRLNPRDFLLDQPEPASQPAYDVFRSAFSRPDYWEKLCRYLSQEVNQKQEDRFSSSNARFFSSIFQTFGDGPLEVAKVQIEQLCFATDQKNAQRAAAEIVSGLIRGTKHWSLDRWQAVWDWLRPILYRTLHGITPDSLHYWEAFIRFSATRRDPRRIEPLIDLILKDELDPTSDAAFNESRKLLLVRALIVPLQWRFGPFADKVLTTYFEHLQHPYKQVREVIGVNLNELLQLCWVPSYPSVEVLLEDHQKSDGLDHAPTELNPQQQHQLEVLIERLEGWFDEMIVSQSTHASSDFAHASKSVLCWLHEAFNHWSVSGTLGYIVPLLPKLFTMQEVNDDQDLQQMATRVLSQLARVNYPPKMLPRMIDQFLTILTTSSSWHIRIRALPILQIFFFKNLFAMESAQLLRIMQVIGHMLLDTQIEVRQLASVTLGGLVRCSQREAIQSLLDQFRARISVRIPKRKRDPVTGKNVEPRGYTEAVLQKHAGVLGLSCLINAFPYEVPEWMPDILCELADCMSDPVAEIQSTIRKTFSDFRRTHSDTWHEDMLKFTEDQLSILSDMLISPSYYA